MRDLYQHQLELEREAVEQGKHEYRKRLLSSRTGKQKPINQQPAGHLLTRKWLPVLTKALDDSLSQTRGSVDARQARAQIKALGLPSEDIVFLGFHQLLETGIQQGRPLQAIATALGHKLKGEVRLRAFNASHGAYVRVVVESYRMEQQLKRGRKSGHLSDSLLRAQERLVEADGPDGTNIDSLDSFRIGMEVLKVLLAVLPEYFTLTKPSKKRLATVVASRNLVEWILERDYVAENRCFTRNYPMVVPPVDRAEASNMVGGYLSLPTKAYPKPSIYAHHKCKPSAKNIAAINIAQKTPWQVNGEVLDVLRWAADKRNGIAGLPVILDYPDRDSPDLSKDQRANIKMEVSKVWIANRASISKLLAVSSQLMVADKFREYESVFFPYFFDWRGRIYPSATGLNPQGDKVSKGLLRFSKATPLGPNGYRWLAIHIANCFGEDKLSFDDRVKWVEDAEDDIIRAAKDPKGHLWWADADSPWQFLAGCFEWARMVEFEGPVAEFKSQIPVALDGTCSGLQHFSALLRDSRGGASVNLVPSSKPSDIYSEVATELQKTIDAQPDEDAKYKRIWEGLVDRGLCKRGTMTRPYSVTRLGMGDQLLDLIKDPAYEVVFERCRFESARMRDGMTDEEWEAAKPSDKPSPNSACHWVAKHLSDSIDSVVIGSRLGQEFLVGLARVYAAAEVPFKWTTPCLGMEITQGYLKLEEIRVATYFGGTRIRMTIKDTGKEPKDNRRKQGSGASPNIIHSYDSTHLMMTVLECNQKANMDSFALVHDSFGVHAGHCDTLAQALRNTFVEMYSTDRLSELRLKALEDIQDPKLLEKIPEVPQMGDLDLEVVRMSKYLFC